jgi:hypothetical protein
MMKKIWLLMLTGMLVLILNGGAFAGDIYYPTPGNLNNLDHAKAYGWGIDLDLEDNETITEFSLIFDNIRNWDNAANVLYVSLLNPSYATVKEYTDSAPGFSNYFNTEPLLFQFNDLNKHEPWDYRDHNYLTENSDGMKITVTINASGVSYTSGLSDPKYLKGGSFSNTANATLEKINEYAAHKIFGLGFDPDCHFYNAGISLILQTEQKVNHTPEPATLMLFGAGLLGLASRMRKKSQIA